MPITRETILAALRSMAEPAYAAFAASLLPAGTPVLGVRLPALRRYARTLARMLPDTPALWQALGGPYLEQRLLWGMVIGAADLSDAERRTRLTAFLPAIDNWSVCDSTAVSCKWMAQAPDTWLPWLRTLAESRQEYTARFGVVCLLDHFTATPQGRRATLAACAAVTCPAAYARLGVAWAVSIAAVREPALGLAFLRESPLDAATHNKAIQKICESRRATPEYRAAVRALRRPGAALSAK